MLKQKKSAGLLAAMLLTANITAAAAAPETTLTLEPRRTAEGIDYDVYIQNTNALSTLIFWLDFMADGAGEMKLSESDCFDISHSEWSNGDNTSLKAYLGRTGQKAGFSSDNKVQVAQISIPLDITKTGEVTASVSGAVCAGILQTDSSAQKGTITVPDSTVRYTVRECSILSLDQNNIHILSSENRSADLIFASYDETGRLTGTQKERIELSQGENEISADEATLSQACSILLWDADSMHPLAEKFTIND